MSKFFTVSCNNGASYQSEGETIEVAKGKVIGNVSKFPSDMEGGIHYITEGTVNEEDPSMGIESMYCPLPKKG